MDLATIIDEASEHLPEGMYLRLFNATKNCKDSTDNHIRHLHHRETKHIHYLRKAVRLTKNYKFKIDIDRGTITRLCQKLAKTNSPSHIINPKTKRLIIKNGITHKKLKSEGYFN